MNVLSALKTLRDNFDCVLDDNVPSPGRYDSFGVNILNPTGRKGAQIRMAQLRFANLRNNQAISINLYYDCETDNFFIRAATGRTFTDSDGEERIIMDSDFYAKKSRNKNDKGEYVFKKTNEIITPEEYRKLPPKPIDRIETYARGYVCEVFRDYLSRCQYRIQASQIKDPRPAEDKNGNSNDVFRYNDTQNEYIATQINSFVTGARGVSSNEESPNTSNNDSQEQATGTDA
jgi:hypothetical protein